MRHVSVFPGGLFHGRDRHTTALRVMIPTGNWRRFSRPRTLRTKGDPHPVPTRLKTGYRLSGNQRRPDRHIPLSPFPSRKYKPAQCRVTFRGYAKFAASQRGIASIINPYPRYSKPFSTKNAANLGEATDRERSRVPAVTRSRAQDDCNDVHGFGIPLATGTR